MNLDFTSLSKYITDPNWWQGFGTVAAVITALSFYFLDRLRTWWNRPILDININFKPPDCHHIPTTVKNINNSLQQFDAFWFRLTVMCIKGDGGAVSALLPSMCSDCIKGDGGAVSALLPTMSGLFVPDSDW